ncbi:hypothetical protein [Streptomyces sp. NPDC048438]
MPRRSYVALAGTLLVSTTSAGAAIAVDQGVQDEAGNGQGEAEELARTA